MTRTLESRIDLYIKSMRNANKKQYAAEYALYLGGETSTEPGTCGLSYMGAQAVRMELHRMFDEEAPACYNCDHIRGNHTAQQPHECTLCKCSGFQY